jgi:hypothetical protein
MWLNFENRREELPIFVNLVDILKAQFTGLRSSRFFSSKYFIIDQMKIILSFLCHFVLCSSLVLLCIFNSWIVLLGKFWVKVVLDIFEAGETLFLYFENLFNGLESNRFILEIVNHVNKSFKICHLIFIISLFKLFSSYFSLFPIKTFF